MKYSQPEKMEIIRMVEDSNLSVRKTLRQIDISRSTFYEWYKRYQEAGYEGLAPKHRTPLQFWNAIPEWEKQRVVEIAREYTEKSCREVAFHITDKEGCFISESSVYRILKAHNLVTSPVYTVISAKDHFEHPTSRVNELWQTDFTYLKVIDWGWYYLLTVLDDYSRYIISWRLCKSMKAEDVKKALEMAIVATGVKHVHVYHRPSLLSDNGPCFISTELKDYLSQYDMKHIRTRTYHPMTQGKIERYHRSMKNLILLDNYYSPTELEARISEWVDHYNNERYHEAIDNVTPSDRFFGRDKEILEQRRKTKAETMRQRREIYRLFMMNNLIGSLS
jgi:transposase InsO family protein